MDEIIFADEKLFLGEGVWDQVWVRRPKGEALNPEYCIDSNPPRRSTYGDASVARDWVTAISSMRM